jgi:hypothetical protein
MIADALHTLLSDQLFSSRVDLTWLKISERYVYHDSQYESPKMTRRELGFHDEVKLLAYVAHLTRFTPGDFLEIGVWKGKSLALIREFCDSEKKVIGIDPLALPGQLDDFTYFYNAILKDVNFIQGFSEQSLSKVLGVTNKLCAIHIDGGHFFNNVLTDFVLYDRLLSSGGIIVFDDYGDSMNSPEVKPAVDYLTRSFAGPNYKVLGTLEKFPNTFLMVKL